MADPHTGLANQLLLLDRLTQSLARRRRHGGEVVVCQIELDNLGEITMDLGYTTGNTVLCEASRRLTSVLRTEDTVGRVGGSELVVVLAVNDEQAVGPLVRRLQQTLDEPVTVGGRSIRLQATLGLAVAEDGESAEDVLARADRDPPGWATAEEPDVYRLIRWVVIVGATALAVRSLPDVARYLRIRSL